MSELKKIVKRSVADFIAHAGLDAEKAARFSPQQSAADALGSLIEAGALEDALKLIAHALPKRESVWWACTCSRAVLGAAPSGDEGHAIKAAEAWVYDPTDDKARAAYGWAEKLGFKTPGGWAAVAAFWSSGSLSPPDQPLVPPAPYLTGVAVAGAVMLAAVVDPVSEISARHRRFLDYGIEIASGGDARAAGGVPR